MNTFDVTINFFNILWHIMGSRPTLLTVIVFTCAAKIFLTVHLAMHMRNNKNNYIKRSCMLLIIVLVSNTFSDFAWILKLTRAFFITTLNPQFCLFWIRIAWAFAIVQYHALALFIESLVEKRNLFGTRQKILLTITGIFFTSLIVFAGISLNAHNAMQLATEIQINKGLLQYGIFPLLLLSLVITMAKLKTLLIPRLLKMQVQIFIKTTIVPFLIFESSSIYPLSLIRSYMGNKYAFTCLSTIILVYAIFYCTRKIIGLRFLNFKSHTESSADFHLINDFRHVLEQFGTVTNARELGHITKTFFEQAFHIHPHKTHLYTREHITHSQTHLDEVPYQHDHREIMLEHFLEQSAVKSLTPTPFKPGEVLFFDELAFNDFYNTIDYNPDMLDLLRQLDADAFIPIMEKDQLLAYIIIDRGSRSKESIHINEFYDETERDYMLVFSDYLRNIMNLLRDGNFDLLLHQKKKLEEDVYLRHQEMNQYKESIQSFIRTSNSREIGIIFYKNNRFALGNRSARDLIQVDLNLHSGHPMAKQFKKFAQQILEYKTSQTCLIDGNNGEKLVISGIPNIEHNNIIITVHYPEISDLLRKKTELLNDPQDWGFFLCLETTTMGQLIDQFIPGHGEILLNFKVKLLKAALGKRAVLLDASGDDLPSLIELIHHIALREQLHSIVLHEPITSPETAIKLFGINSMLSLSIHDRPLLETLNHSGTLFIQNVHFLDLETQDHLAEFLRYGVYRKLKTDHKTHSNARVICSTNKNLHEAMQAGTFSKNLFEELNNNTLVMPSLSTISKDERHELIEIIVKQTLRQQPALNNLLELSEREKQKLLSAHLPSLQELRIKIKSLLVEKSKHNTPHDEENELFEGAYTTFDQELVEAAQLGKQALKNKQVMVLLWKKFQNQNKIAMFLGVNRSSVNRRCKEHGLIE